MSLNTWIRPACPKNSKYTAAIPQRYAVEIDTDMEAPFQERGIASTLFTFTHQHLRHTARI